MDYSVILYIFGWLVFLLFVIIIARDKIFKKIRKLKKKDFYIFLQRKRNISEEDPLLSDHYYSIFKKKFIAHFKSTKLVLLNPPRFSYILSEKYLIRIVFPLFEFIFSKNNLSFEFSRS